MVSNLAALWMGAVYEKVKADDCRLMKVSCGVALHSWTVGLRFCRPHFNCLDVYVRNRESNECA